MKRAPGPVLPLVLVAFFATLGAARPAKGVAIKRVTELKVGDRGYCLTVFRGLRPERFRMRVQGILFNYFPRQHLILITSDDPKVRRSGIVAGMSGSPCFVGGKLVGALAYGPNWTKRPVALLTPIRYMLDELKRPLRGVRRSPVASRPHRPSPAPWLGRSRPPRAHSVAARWLAWRSGRNPLSPWYRAVPAPPAARVRRAVAGMRRLSVPLSVSGLDAQSLKELRADLKPYGMQVVQGGGSSQDALRYYPKPRGFVAGGSIGVQLMRGAISMNGTGTVTVVSGKRVLAFGHPMSNWGEHYIPVTASWVHMFMPSYSSSYKITTALQELGSLVMDRRPCIQAEIGRKAPMIPVKVRVRSKAGGLAHYDFEVFSNRKATPYYVAYALRSILRKEVSDLYDTTLSVRFAFETTGAGRFALKDYFFTRKGAGLGFSIASTRGYRILSFLLSTPLGRVRLKGVQIQVRVEHTVHAAALHALRLPRADLRPGETVPLRIALRRKFGGGRYEVTVPVRIPRAVPPGSLVRIEVAAGPSAAVDMAPPETLADVRRIVARMYHARQLVVRVFGPGEGTSIRGRIVSHLPGSVLDSLRQTASAQTRIIHRASGRTVRLLPDVLSGRLTLTVRVAAPTP